MSAIGNFDIAAPPQAVLNAYARLFAWKLSLYNIRADAPRVYVKNRWFQAINGHRDVGQTACPGRYLYAKIPTIRTADQTLQNARPDRYRSADAHADARPDAAARPDGFTSPTQTPRPATAQPEGIDLPARR